MLNFGSISKEVFLEQYWQKKPLLMRQAIPNFQLTLSADELAGLAMETEVESRLVMEKPLSEPSWTLQHGPFTEQYLSQLPKSHWTLLVQSVNVLIPEINYLREHFNFIPQWRFDDLMISIAGLQGSVGPHFDNYDVFLYQAQGKREWKLTTKNCNEANYIPNLELRIMRDFQVEENFILEEGDLLYLPAHVGHYGISLSELCMTYSFGYRSYGSQEIIEHFTDYLAENVNLNSLYCDPSWRDLEDTNRIPETAVSQARELLQQVINNKKLFARWFGCFATKPNETEEHMDMQYEGYTDSDLNLFLERIYSGMSLQKNPVLRFAYFDENNIPRIFINGIAWNGALPTVDLLYIVGNFHCIDAKQIEPMIINSNQNQIFLFLLWKNQFLEWMN